MGSQWVQRPANHPQAFDTCRRLIVVISKPDRSSSGWTTALTSPALSDSLHPLPTSRTGAPITKRCSARCSLALHPPSIKWQVPTQSLRQSSTRPLGSVTKKALAKDEQERAFSESSPPAFTDSELDSPIRTRAFHIYTAHLKMRVFQRK